MTKTFAFFAITSNLTAGLTFDSPVVLLNLLVAGFIAGWFVCERLGRVAV